MRTFDAALSRSVMLVSSLSWAPQCFAIPMRPPIKGEYIVVWLHLKRSQATPVKVSQLSQESIERLRSVEGFEKYTGVELVFAENEARAGVHEKIVRIGITRSAADQFLGRGNHMFEHDIEEPGVSIVWYPTPA